MSLLRAEKRAQRREEKAAAKQHTDDGLDTPAPIAEEPSSPPKPKRNWGKKLSSPRTLVWVANIALLGWLGYAWSGQYLTQMREKELATEVAYRVNRFTGEIAFLEREKNTLANFNLNVGEAPYLMRGELHLLWEEPPRDDIAFMWQNDHFARQRGVVVVSTDRNLLQEVDAMIDDGDLGNGSAQMHPRGLWVSLR